MYKFINKLKGKRVLIFGGTSGIGYAVAEGCIEYGATVLISGSNQAKLDKTVQRLKTSYPDVSEDQIATHLCDLSDANALDSNLKALLDSFTKSGKINHVVFTAGDHLGDVPSLANLSIEGLRKFQTVRGVAPMMLAKHLSESMEKSSDSSFTLTGGVNTTRPLPGWSILAAGGGSGEGLSRGLAVDLAPIRCNLVSPGAVETELLAGLPASVKESFAEASTVKKVGKPEDVAEAYLYCMKDGFVTGSIIASNGGRLLV